ncbi:MAG: rod shape-determining protein MreC [bacterium]|nr:rod shape-determining protein MreC [bacterium]MDZ4285256.1 rod shape-determining protein MreC [Patescibacteria group bacterium]
MSSFSSRKRLPKRRAVLIAGSVLALAACLSFFHFGLPSFVLSPISAVGRIAHEARASVAAALESLSGGASSKMRLAGENRVLRERVSALEATLESLSRRTEDDRVLLASLGRGRGTGERVVGAVIAKPGVLPYDLLLIDVGRDVGVTPGTLVLALGDQPIGVVAEAASRTAKVRLFSSSGETHDVLIGESALPVVLRGVGGGAFIAELPRDSGISPGALVHWAGSPVRAIGTIEEIEGDETDPFVTAHVRFLTPLFELRWVEVEIGPPVASF